MKKYEILESEMALLKTVVATMKSAEDEILHKIIFKESLFDRSIKMLEDQLSRTEKYGAMKGMGQ